MNEHITHQKVAMITGANKGIGRATAQGAAAVVRLATLGADGPTGGFFGEGGPVPW